LFLSRRLQERAAEKSSESNGTLKPTAAQRVYVVKSSAPQPDVQKKSLLHNLLRKATFI